MSIYRWHNTVVLGKGFGNDLDSILVSPLYGIYKPQFVHFNNDRYTILTDGEACQISFIARFILAQRSFLQFGAKATLISCLAVVVVSVVFPTMKGSFVKVGSAFVLFVKFYKVTSVAYFLLFQIPAFALAFHGVRRDRLRELPGIRQASLDYAQKKKISRDIAIVAEKESRQIYESMKAKGLDVTYVLFPDEGHQFAKFSNKMTYLDRSELFLSQHLGGKSP